MERVTLAIEGMSCGGCVLSVEKALAGVRGVSRATVSLADKRAEVEGDGLDATALKDAVEAAGFDVDLPSA